MITILFKVNTQENYETISMVPRNKVVRTLKRIVIILYVKVEFCFYLFIFF